MLFNNSSVVNCIEYFKCSGKRTLSGFWHHQGYTTVITDTCISLDILSSYIYYILHVQVIATATIQEIMLFMEEG